MPVEQPRGVVAASVRRLSVVLLLALAVPGCNAASVVPDFGIAATAVFDDTVDDAALGRVVGLSFHASGDESYDEVVTLGRAVARTERVFYVPGSTTRSLTLAVDALDAEGNEVAAGSSPVLTLVAGETTPVQIVLSAPMVLVDGGPDAHVDGGVDAADAAMDASLVEGGPDMLTCVGFCDDFDARTTLKGGWTAVQVRGAGSAGNGSISSAQSVSAPHSAKFHSPMYASAFDDGLVLSYDGTLIAEKVTLDFDARIVGYAGGGAGSYVNLVSIAAGGHFTGGYTLESATQVALDYFVEAPDGGINHPISNIDIQDGAWHHVHYEEVFSASAGSVFASYDSATIIDVTNAQTWAFGALPTTFNLSIGTVARDQTGAFDAYYDNIQIR